MQPGGCGWQPGDCGLQPEGGGLQPGLFGCHSPFLARRSRALLQQGGVGAWGLREQEMFWGRVTQSRGEPKRKALRRRGAALPSLLLPPSHQPAGLTPLSLPPDVSIFSLKEIQLQKDPGYRGSAFQQSGRSGKMALTPLLDGTTGSAGTGVTPSGYPRKRKPNLLPALVYKLPLRHPHSSPVGT